MVWTCSYAKTWLQFVFPLYLWALAGGIILVYRFSVRATRFFGNNAVQVLATLFLLSYNKLLQTITVFFSSADVVHVDMSNSQESSKAVWAFDGNLQFLKYISSCSTLCFQHCCFCTSVDPIHPHHSVWPVDSKIQPS